MSQKIPVEDAFKNLLTIINDMRFTPVENAQLQNGLKILNNSIVELKPSPNGNKKNGNKKK